MLKLIGYVIVILVFWETFAVAVSLNPHCRIPEQWGTATYANLVSTAIFPISFSNTNYIGVATGILEDDSQAFIRGILRTHKALNSCLFRASEQGGPAAEYLVIGF